MVETVVPTALFLSIAFAVVGVAKIVSDGRTRRQLVQSSASAEMARAVLAPPQADPGLHDALKWGLVIGAVGLALVVVQFLPYRPDQPIVYGTVLLFAAAGLLAYYALGRRMARPARGARCLTRAQRHGPMSSQSHAATAAWRPSSRSRGAGQ